MFICLLFIPVIVLLVGIFYGLFELICKNNKKSDIVQLTPEIYHDISSILKEYDSYKPWNRPDELKMIHRLAEKYNQPDKTIIRWIRTTREINIKKQRGLIDEY